MLRCLATGLAEAAGVGRNLDAATKTRFSVALGGAASISTTPDLLTGLELKAVKDLQGMLQDDGANPPSSSRVPGDGLGDQTEYNQDNVSTENGSSTSTERPIERGGPKGVEPTRFGDWERNGRCTDF